MKRKTQSKLTILLLGCALVAAGTPAFAAESKQDGPPKPKTRFAPQAKEDSKKRNFYQVLEDVLADFEYDLKNGRVKGLKQLAIRNIAMSENVPKSFSSHLELLVTERIIQNTNANLIQCLQCRSKKATLQGKSMVISSPEGNPEELARIAKVTGINNFLDVAFSYQPTGMIISMHISDADSAGVVWSRSYNSETSRAAAFRRGVDFSQMDEARNQIEYEPTIMYRPTVYYLFEADNNSGYTGALGVGFRMVERYDNRKKEVGFELNYLLNSNSLVGNTSTDTNVYDSFNLTLLFVHAWNMFGDLENYHSVRGSLFAAIGGTYASGFLGGLIRAGYEWRFGKHWALSANVGYRPPATYFVSGTSSGEVTGAEFGLGISALF